MSWITPRRAAGGVVACRFRVKLQGDPSVADYLTVQAETGGLPLSRRIQGSRNADFYVLSCCLPQFMCLLCQNDIFDITFLEKG